MEKSEKKLLIEQKQKELKIASIRNKMIQFDIRILELEEEMDRMMKEKAACEAAIITIQESEQA